MDDFDDLLAPSRRALEENPFANPFSTERSHSPDPWASPFANTQRNDGFESSSVLDPYSTQESYQSLSSPTRESRGEEESITKVEEPPLSDPLDSAARMNDGDESPDHRTSPRSPGFRESLESPEASFNEIATIRPTEPEKFDGSPILSTNAQALSPQLAQSEREQVNEREEHSRGDSGFIAHMPARTKSPEFVSPLDGGIGSAGGVGFGIERSIAGLTLGGETLTSDGWGGEQVGWGVSSEPMPSTSTVSGEQPEEEEDSDDDRPISQTLSRMHSEDQDKAKALAMRKGGKADIQPVFVITVDDPQKVGDPIRSFTMYTVYTRTTSTLYQKFSFSVLRRYSDFLWLYETLQSNNPGVVVPPVPEKNTFGRFDDTFVRQRRMALEKCIQKIANHPVLAKDPDLKFFLESDNFALDMKHRKAEGIHEKGGLIFSIGQTLTGPRFHETDEWFDRQKVYLDSLESQLKGLVKAIEIVARQRAELAVVTGEFAQTISDLAASDVGTHLSRSLSGLADVERKAQEIQAIQSDQDMVTLLATADEYSRLINSVRLAFSSRIRTFHQWKTSEAELLRIKRSHEKNRAQGQIPADRLSYSLQQIAEAERRASESKMEYEQVSKLVKQEVARFEQERINDFKDSLHSFLEGMISRQKELISSWENYQQMLLKKADGASEQTPAFDT